MPVRRHHARNYFGGFLCEAGQRAPALNLQHLERLVPLRRDQLESTGEELRSASEELETSNEELRSTNEELEWIQVIKMI